MTLSYVFGSILDCPSKNIVIHDVQLVIGSCLLQPAVHCPVKILYYVKSI